MIVLPSTYELFRYDSNSSIQTKLNDLMSNYNSSDIISLGLAKSLKCHASTTLYLYGLNKIHKHDIPISPIINYTSSPLFKLSKFIYNLHKTLTVGSLFSIHTLYQFLRDLKSLQPPLLII